MNIFNRVNIKDIHDGYVISYRKLFVLLNERGLGVSELRKVLSPKVVAKFSKGENVNTDSIVKVCGLLNCQPGDIMEVREAIFFRKGK